MNIIQTDIPGLAILEPDVFSDPRGYFFESYNESKLLPDGFDAKFVQDNESKSVRGTLRGLHYQKAPYAQTKLVRVIVGEVYDVAVDVRKGSPTFGQWFGILLSGENKKQFYISKGFAHGFSVISETAIFAYKCDAFYNKSSEGGIRYNDPTLNIDWKVPASEILVSDKDAVLPDFEQADYNFKF